MANKKRLIDANRALEIVRDQGHAHPNAHHLTNCATLILREAPTVDAVEVVHAHWECVNESENVWMCTGKNGCGDEILLLEGTPAENGWKYCPSCGAKMDGERREGE